VKISIIDAKKPVEVGLLNNVLVYEFQMSYALAGEKVCGGASNSSGANDCDLG